MTDIEKKIRDAGLHNVIVHKCLVAQHNNNLTWVETLEHMTMFLIEENSRINEDLLKAAREHCGCLGSFVGDGTP